jgi:transposase
MESCHAESLRSWVHRVEIDDGVKPGLSNEVAEKMRRLEQENRELKRANQILKRASASFAAEPDRPQK